MWGVRGSALSHAPPPVLGACGRTRHPLAEGAGAVGVRSPTPQRALLRTSCERCGGGWWAFKAGAPCLGVGRPGLSALPGSTACPWGVRPGPVTRFCGHGGPAVRGRRCVSCALPGFATGGGHCCLAPVLVLWLWPAACLSAVPRGPALVPRASSGAVALGAPVGFPVAVVPSPTPGAVGPGLHWAVAQVT